MLYVITKRLSKLKGLNKTIIFDMVDIHHLRLRRALDMDPNNDQFKNNTKSSLSGRAGFAVGRCSRCDFQKQKLNILPTFAPVKNSNHIRACIMPEKMLIPSHLKTGKTFCLFGSTHTLILMPFIIYNDIMPLVVQNPNLVVNIVGNVNEKINDI